MIAFYLTDMVSGGSLVDEAPASSVAMESNISLSIGIGLGVILLFLGIYIPL